MSGNDHAEHLGRLCKELVAAVEKRAGLKVNLASLSKGPGTDKSGEKRKTLKRNIQQLSRKIDGLIGEIAQPPPRKMERWTGVLPVTLQVESRGKKYEHPASTLDLSDRGLRILTTTALTPGQTLDVYSNRSRLGHCRVVWVSGGGTARPSEVGLEILH